MHATSRLREEFCDLLTQIVYHGSDNVKRLHYLAGQLWNCTDIMPSSAIDDINSVIEETLYIGSTYAAGMRKLKPAIQKWLEE